MAMSPKWVAAFVFVVVVAVVVSVVVAFSSQVGARKEVFVVEGHLGYGDGFYAEEGHRSSAHYKRLGGADDGGDHFYLYRGTERRGTWVLGWGKNFETRIARFRAPAGSAAGQPPPVSGWQYVIDGSKDGEESWDDRPNVRVTRLQLDEKETAAGVFERGGGETVGGIICRTDDGGDVVSYLSFMYWVKKGSNILSHNQT